MNKIFVYLIFFLNNLFLLFIILRQRKIKLKKFGEYKFYLFQKQKLFFLRIFIIFIVNILFLFLLLDLKGGTKRIEVKDDFIDTALLIDVSTSMKVQDIYPDRLKASILLANSLIKRSKNVRYSLIIFSTEPYIQVPFTSNIEFFSFILNGLKIETKQTSFINNAISKGYSLIRRTPGKLKYIFIFSDMEFWEDIDKNLIRLITGEGIRLYFFIVGTSEGGRIPDENSFLKDENGEFVISKVNYDLIQKLNNINNVFFYKIDKLDFDEFEKIYNDIFNLEFNGKKYIIVYYKFYWIFGLLIFLFYLLYFIFYSPLFIKINIKNEFKTYN